MHFPLFPTLSLPDSVQPIPKPNKVEYNQHVEKTAIPQTKHVSQLRYHIVEAGGQDKSDCTIYFVDQDEKGAAKFEPIEISPNGNILNWPDGFFDETMHQEDRITAASLRKRRKKQRMANIFIDPAIVMTPPDNANREEVEAWLANFEIWLHEALSSRR